MKLDELLLLATAENSPTIPVKEHEHVLVVSPTRGLQFTQARTHPFTKRLCFMRIGGPANYNEETSDIIDDGMPFLVVEFTLDLLVTLRMRAERAERRVAELEGRIH